MILAYTYKDSATEYLKELHWLSIKSRIQFKILTIVYKFLNDCHLKYVTNLLCLNTSSRKLCSEDNKNELIIPCMKNWTFVARSFSVMGAKLWNDLPNEIRSTNSIIDLKKLLKTFLFSDNFWF